MYSVGAAIVILGVLFKMIDMPYGNIIFVIGLVTEIAMFLISAFDRPVTDYEWDRVFPALKDEQHAQSHAPVDTETQSFPIQHAQPQMSYSPTETIASQPNLSEYDQQMSELTSRLSELNVLYQHQLQSISTQVSLMNTINDGLAEMKNYYSDSVPNGSIIKGELEKMTLQLRELNQAYARMIEALSHK